MKLTNIILAIIIPILYIALGFVFMLLGLDVYSATIGVQVFTILMLIPYFIKNKEKYIFLSNEIVNACITMFLCIMGIMFIYDTVIMHHMIYFKYQILFSTLVISSLVIAPMTEEMYYRGLLFDLLGKLDIKIKMAVIGILFSVSHYMYFGNVRAMITIALLGAYLTYVRNRYNSLIPSMLLHFTFNFISLLLMVL